MGWVCILQSLMKWQIKGQCKHEYISNKTSDFRIINTMLMTTGLSSNRDNSVLWYGLDLSWAYADLLPGIRRQTTCVQLAYDVLHDALLRFALTKNPERITQPHAYLRTVVKNILADNYREMARFVPFLLETPDTSSDSNDQITAHQIEDAFSPSPE